MSLNTKIRYLVLNRTNQAVAPRDEMLEGYDPADLKASGEIPKKFSPSFVNEATARGFAEALALKYGGERFYVAKVLAGVQSEAVAWSEASPVTSLADTATADDLAACTDNE
jgi:hypothetical protein